MPYTALSSGWEELRICVLRFLEGVSWPMASVILLSWHCDPYPVLDYRELWSRGLDVPPAYIFKSWWKYTEFCRRLAKECSLSMRRLDRALWQFSSENQKPNDAG